MTSRPQFSIATLLFVVGATCFAAATFHQPPENRPLANIAQSSLRIALCVTFPALLMAAVIHTRGYVRSFCTGGLVPALTALIMMCFIPFWYSTWEPPSIFWPVLGCIWRELPGRCREMVILWAFIPCSGCACLAFDRLFRLSAPAGPQSPALRRWLWLRGVLFATVVISAALLTIKSSKDHWFAYGGQQLLSIGLSIVFPAMLACGAVQARGYLKTFFVAATIPASTVLMFVCFAGAAATTFGKHEGGLFFDDPDALDLYLIPYWMFALLFGLTVVGFRRLLRRGARGDLTRSEHSTPSSLPGW